MKLNFVKIYNEEEFYDLLVSLDEMDDDSDFTTSERVSDMTLIGRELGYVNVVVSGSSDEFWMGDYFIEYLKDELTSAEVFALADAFGLIEDGIDLADLAYETLDLELLDNGKYIT